MKAYWKTIFALLVAAGLGAYIFFVDAKKPGGDEKTKEKVFSVDRGKISEVTLSRTDGDPVHVVKEDQGWKLVGHTKVDADPNAVDNLLSTVESAQVNDSVTDSATSVAEYGLEHPHLTVDVVAAGKKQQVQFGRKTPDDMGVYAKYADKAKVFTVPTHIEMSFEKKPIELRDRNVLHLKRDAVRKLDIKGPGDELQLVKDEKGDWSFTKPLQTKAARWSVDGILLSMENLVFDDLASEDAADLKPYGLDHATWTVSLELADGSAKKLEIGGSATPSEKQPAVETAGAGPKYYARDAAHNMVGVIAPSLVNDLGKAWNNLRSRYLLDFPALEVKEVEVTSDGKTRKYVRTITKDAAGMDVRKWKQTSPETKDIETKEIEDLLFEVASTDVKEFIDHPGPLSTYGLDAPAIHVALTFDNRLPGWFEVGLKGDEAYGRRDNDVTITKLAPKAKDSVVERFRRRL